MSILSPFSRRPLCGESICNGSGIGFQAGLIAHVELGFTN